MEQLKVGTNDLP
jgi:hypothetical protein